MKKLLFFSLISLCSFLYAAEEQIEINSFKIDSIEELFPFENNVREYKSEMIELLTEKGFTHEECKKVLNGTYQGKRITYYRYDKDGYPVEINHKNRQCMII